MQKIFFTYLGLLPSPTNGVKKLKSEAVEQQHHHHQQQQQQQQQQQSINAKKFSTQLALPSSPVFPPFNPYTIPRPTWPYSVWNFSPIMPSVSPYALSPALASYAFNTSFGSYPI